MKLINDLYRVIETHVGEGTCECDIELNPDCDIYRGHFPDNPITPGVVMMGIAREIMEETLGSKLRLSEVPSVKYTSVLSPLEYPVVRYNISYNIDGKVVKGKVTILSGTVTFARMSLEWETIQ